MLLPNSLKKWVCVRLNHIPKQLILLITKSAECEGTWNYGNQSRDKQPRKENHLPFICYTNINIFLPSFWTQDVKARIVSLFVQLNISCFFPYIVMLAYVRKIWQSSNFSQLHELGVECYPCNRKLQLPLEVSNYSGQHSPGNSSCLIKRALSGQCLSCL